MDKYTEYNEIYYKKILEILLDEKKSEVIQDFTSDIYNYYKFSVDSFKNFKALENKFDLDDQDLIKVHNKNVLKYEQIADAKKQEITTLNITNINNIKDDLNKNLELINASKISTLNQIETNNNSLKHQILIEEKRNNNYINKLNNEISSIKETFSKLANSIVEDSNLEYENIKSTSNKQTYRYNEAINYIISNYQNQIDKHKLNLENYNNDLFLLKNNNNKKIIELQTSTNNLIFPINKEKLEKERLIKQKYLKFKTNQEKIINNIEKKFTTKKTNYTRNFIKNIEEINNEIAILNKNFSDEILKVKKDYSFSKLEVIKQVNEVDGYRSINKNLNNLKDTLEDELDIININYSKKINHLEQNKKKLEIQRDIKFNEFDDLKQIKQLPNYKDIDIYANKLDFDILENNVNHQIRINKFINNLEKEKYDEYAKYYDSSFNLFEPKTELIYNIKTLNEEINYTTILNNDSNTMTEDLLQNELRILQINNSLQLEINNYLMLLEENRLHSKFNTTSIKSKNSIERLKLLTKKKNIIIDSQIDSLELNIKKLKKQISYEIEKQQQDEIKSINLVDIDKDILIYISLNTYLQNRFNLLQELLNNLFNIINVLYKRLTNMFKLLSSNCSDIELLNKIQYVTIMYLENMFNTTFDVLIDYINDHITHQTKDKFKPLYDALFTQYNQNVTKHNKLIESLYETISNYQITIKQFRRDSKSYKDKTYLQKIQKIEKSIKKITIEISNIDKLKIKEELIYNKSMYSLDLRKNKEAYFLSKYVNNVKNIKDNINHHFTRIINLELYQPNKLNLLERYLNFENLTYLNKLKANMEDFHKNNAIKYTEKQLERKKQIEIRYKEQINLINYSSTLYLKEIENDLLDIVNKNKKIEHDFTNSLKENSVNINLKEKQLLKQSNDHIQKLNLKIKACNYIIENNNKNYKKNSINQKNQNIIRNKLNLKKSNKNRDTLLDEKLHTIKKQKEMILQYHLKRNKEFQILDNSLIETNKYLLNSINPKSLKHKIDLINKEFKNNKKDLELKYKKKYKTN